MSESWAPCSGMFAAFAHIALSATVLASPAVHPLGPVMFPGSLSLSWLLHLWHRTNPTGLSMVAGKAVEIENRKSNYWGCRFSCWSVAVAVNLDGEHRVPCCACEGRAFRFVMPPAGGSTRGNENKNKKNISKYRARNFFVCCCGGVRCSAGWSQRRGSQNVWQSFRKTCVTYMRCLAEKITSSLVSAEPGVARE